MEGGCRLYAGGPQSWPGKSPDATRENLKIESVRADDGGGGGDERVLRKKRQSVRILGVCPRLTRDEGYGGAVGASRKELVSPPPSLSLPLLVIVMCGRHFQGWQAKKKKPPRQILRAYSRYLKDQLVRVECVNLA